MSAGRVVVVEDEPVIRQAIVQMLDLAGYEVFEAADGEAGLTTAQGPGVELVLLDLMLPKRDGLSVLAELRKLRPGLPVIILTAKGSEEDVVRGLKEGADDYVVKPFGARELMARIEAVMRRTPARPQAPDRLELGGWSVDFEQGLITRPDGGQERLSATESQILARLASNPGQIVSREELLSLLWGQAGSRAETRTIDMHIAKLRVKLGDSARDPNLILTVRGKGYRLGTGEGTGEDVAG
jgi:two-component system, OmpR family, response regulator RpaB